MVYQVVLVLLVFGHGSFANNVTDPPLPNVTDPIQPNVTDTLPPQLREGRLLGLLAREAIGTLVPQVLGGSGNGGLLEGIFNPLGPLVEQMKQQQQQEYQQQHQQQQPQQDEDYLAFKQQQQQQQQQHMQQQQEQAAADREARLQEERREKELLREQVWQEREKNLRLELSYARRLQELNAPSAGK
jgi:membrane protein involved in colicin uptake